VRKRYLAAMALGALALAATCIHAQNLDALSPYRPEQQVSGTIRSWGDDYMGTLLKYWQEGFSKYQPEVKFVDNLKSTATAIGGMYAGGADLGLMGREIWPMEALGFRRVFGYEPLGIVPATGAYDVNAKTWAQVIFVNQDNPLSKLTFKQLDAIFGAEHLRGAPKNFRKWGDLGLKGEWAEQPIHVYGYKVDSGFAFFFAQQVLNGSGLWNGELHQIGTQIGKSMADDARLAIEAVGKDRYAIAYTGMQFRTPQVKPLALAVQDGGPFIEPTKANVARRRYPLTRSVFIFINRAPGKPVAPAVKKFLRYILSREGQQGVVREGDFLPLTAEAAREQLRKLE